MFHQTTGAGAFMEKITCTSSDALSSDNGARGQLSR